MMNTILQFAFIFLTVFFSPMWLLAAEPDAEDSDPGRRWLEKSQQPGLEPFEIEAYRQLARLHQCQFPQEDHWGSFSVITFGSEPNVPTDILHEMGLKVLPILSEAIDDKTPTRTVTKAHHELSTEHVWKVNELVVRLIRRIADREFVLGEWGEGAILFDVNHHEDRWPEFQNQILLWYQHNKERTEEERKIADLESNLRNRLDATIWLGEHQSKKAVPFLIDGTNQILKYGKRSSSTEAELSEACLALGRIGDSAALPIIMKVCPRFSDGIYRSYRPASEGRLGIGSNDLVYLFRAYQGLALLGKKEEALAELKRLQRMYINEMHVYTRKDYQELMEKAQQWEENASRIERQVQP